MSLEFRSSNLGQEVGIEYSLDESRQQYRVDEALPSRERDFYIENRYTSKLRIRKHI